MASIRGKRKRRASINNRSKLVPWCRLAWKLIALREEAAGGSGRYGEQLAMSILAEKSFDRPVMNKYETLFHRHPSNPILTGKDWPYSMNSVFNAGATLLPDGSTLLLCRVEDRRGLSPLCVARSSNGVDGWQID